MIRSGADKAVISAVFEVEGGAAKDGRPNPRRKRHRLGKRLRHSAPRNCRGRQGTRVRQQPARDGCRAEAELAPYLATVHAQNESLAAFDAPARLRSARRIRRCAGRARVHDAFHNWKDIRTSHRRTGARRAGPPAAARSVDLPEARDRRRQVAGRAKTSASKPRSASWPTPRRSTARP